VKLLNTYRLVLLGLTVPSLLMLLVGCLQWQSMREGRESRELFARTEKVLLGLEEVRAGINDAESGQRGYLLTHQDQYLDPYNAALLSTRDQIVNLRSLTADEPEQQKNLDRLDRLTTTRFAELEQTVELEQNNQHPTAVQMMTNGFSPGLTNQIRATLRDMRDNETDLLGAKEDAYQRDFWIDAGLSVALVGVGLSFIVSIVLMIRRLQQLQSMITICAWSKMIEYEGEWLSVEEYLSRRFRVKITHGISRVEAERVMKLLEEEKRKIQQGL
jgi:CHASE3 domain sensor protein